VKGTPLKAPHEDPEVSETALIEIVGTIKNKKKRRFSARPSTGGCSPSPGQQSDPPLGRLSQGHLHLCLPPAFGSGLDRRGRLSMACSTLRPGWWLLQWLSGSRGHRRRL